MLKGFTFLKTKEFKVQTWKKISILEVTSWRRGCKPIMPGTILIPLWVSHWWKRHTLRVGQWYLNGTKYKGQQNELSCRPMYISLCMCVIYCTRSPIIMEVENSFQGNYYWKGTHVCLPWLWEEVYVNVCFVFWIYVYLCVWYVVSHVQIACWLSCSTQYLQTPWGIWWSNFDTTWAL